MKPPIFIIGNPRSGTTLLRLMLTCHRNIVIPPECGFMIWWYEKYKDWNANYSREQLDNFLDDLFSSKKIETWNLNRSSLKTILLDRHFHSYAALISNVYKFYAITQKASFKRWGDKNNFHLNHIETILGLFSQAQFIHIVRDGRDIACSYKKLAESNFNSKYAPKLPSDVYDIAMEWMSNIKKIRSSFETINWDKVIEIRYEDLVSYPEKTLRNICTFLNEEFDPLMLEFYLKNRENELEPKELLEWKGETLENITTSQVQVYKYFLSNQEIDVFNNIAGEVLRIYAYY